KSNGLRVARRATGELITDRTDIYLADTLGELGLFFRLADIAFIGGSLVGKGGHNPFEAARLDCAILHGPDMTNCAAMADALAAADASKTIRDAESLARAVAELLADPRLRDARAAAAARIAAAGDGARDAGLALARLFIERGIAVHVVTRGYGGDLPGPVRIDPARHDANAVGDEALLIAARTPCWVARDRAAGIAAAAEAGAAAILLDDGFQN